MGTDDYEKHWGRTYKLEMNYKTDCKMSGYPNSVRITTLDKIPDDTICYSRTTVRISYHMNGPSIPSAQMIRL